MNNFGSEDTSHITEEFMFRLLKVPHDMIPRMVQAIHFNKDKPENKNIMITNKKENMVKVVENGQWVCKAKEEALFDLVDGKYYMLDSFYNDMKLDRIEELNLRLSREDRERYDEFSREYDKGCENPKDSKLIGGVVTKCFFMIINQKEDLSLEELGLGELTMEKLN